MTKALTLFFLLFLAVACAIPIYTPTYQTTDRIVRLPAGSTFKLIHGQPNNPIHNKVELVLQNAGYAIISSNLITTTVPTADVRYSTSDTTIYRSERGVVTTTAFPDRPSDYVIRYSYTGTIGSPDSFNASLIDPTDGRVLYSYGASNLYGYEGRVDRVLNHFVQDMNWKVLVGEMERPAADN